MHQTILRDHQTLIKLIQAITINPIAWNQKVSLCSYIPNIEIHLNLESNLIEELEGGEVYLKIQKSGSTLGWKIFFSLQQSPKSDLSLSHFSFFPWLSS